MPSLRKGIGRWTTNPTAQAIRTIRLHLRETQSEFAARFNVWQNSVCRWETGRVTPSPWALVQLLSLATNNEQTQGIRAALDAAGISIDQLQHLVIVPPHKTSIQQLQEQGHA